MGRTFVLLLLFWEKGKKRKKIARDPLRQTSFDWAFFFPMKLEVNAISRGPVHPTCGWKTTHKCLLFLSFSEQVGKGQVGGGILGGEESGHSRKTVSWTSCPWNVLNLSSELPRVTRRPLICGWPGFRTWRRNTPRRNATRRPPCAWCTRLPWWPSTWACWRTTATCPWAVSAFRWGQTPLFPESGDSQQRGRLASHPRRH